MPNHITNIITYNGDRKHIEKMLEDIRIDELGIGTVDFNKIIPMPDDIYKGMLIRQYDRPVSFFYCDPPYFATESYYKDVGFTTKDHIRLRDTLLGISGKFLVSYNDCPEIRELWNKPGIYIEEISRINNLAQRYEGGCQYAELLISNYDTSERAKMTNQLSFFDDNGGLMT